MDESPIESVPSETDRPPTLDYAPPPRAGFAAYRDGVLVGVTLTMLSVPAAIFFEYAAGKGGNGRAAIVVIAGTAFFLAVLTLATWWHRRPFAIGILLGFGTGLLIQGGCWAKQLFA